MNEGYIKLHRRAMDSAVFCNANLWQVWCWALMRANHRPRSILFNGKQEYLKPGQFISGRFAGAKECRMSPSTFRNQLDGLISMGNLDSKSDNRKTIFTVVKWAQYQIVDESRTADRTATGQQPDTDKNERMEEQDRPFDPKDAFASIWEKYPKRLKRKAAERHFVASVKSEADLVRIMKALDNYKANLAKNKTEEKFIQYGSTWFNDWESWEKVGVAPKTLSPLALSEMEHRNAANS